ncbi:MAG: 50S ribosomal protein L19 [Spirochaetales bacterium]|nr:50S ribosomal protein L19 [Spirochaetales bacterium]MCF7937437.1 50S ribosomal protein L19 [Spirochaetales bacterium]
MDTVRSIEQEQMKNEDELDFRVGDVVKVHFRIIEGKTERIQVFEGLCIAMKNAGISRTFTVRKMSYGVGVERVFPIHSPRVQKVEVVRNGRVRRAKLYYIRERVGKAAKVSERIKRKESKTVTPASD